jgi:uroporphyrinogen decarboxylase
VEQRGQPVRSDSPKPLLRALAGETLAVPPFWLMRQAGRYLPEYRELRKRAPSFLDFCLTPELAAEATLQPIRRFGMDAAILFSDILVVPHALGQAVTFPDGKGPVLEPVRMRAAAERLESFGTAERLGAVYDTVRRVKSALPRETALIGFAGSPWTVATYMVEGGTSRDFAHAKNWAFADPDGFGDLIDKITHATVEHLAAQIEAGADAVQLFDSWASALDEPSFRQYVIAPTRRIVTELRKRWPTAPIIGFPRGAGLMYRAYVSETEITALGLDTTVPPAIARRTLQSLVPVQGNLDPVLLLAGGARLEEGVAAILAGFRGGPFVFNLGHGVLPETPVAHVSQLAELVRRAP